MIKRTSNLDIERIIVDLGIESGDVLMIHADLRIFGIIENGGQDVVSILNECVGPNGCLLTPSFTFSFPGVFDIQKSLTKTGALGKLFSRRNDVLRVPDGMTSYYIIGKDSLDLIENWDHSSYGKNSIPDQFVERNGKVVQLGTDILSLVHYVEEAVGVPYREVKTFTGVIKDGSRRFDSYTNLYVRRENVAKSVPDPIRVSYFAEKSQHLSFNDRTCRCFKAKEYVEYARPRLLANRRILIQE